LPTIVRKLPQFFAAAALVLGRMCSKWDSQTAQRLLLYVVDAGLAGVIFGAPWLMGGRHPLGQLVLVALVCLVAMAWTARQCLAAKSVWRWSGVEFLLLAALLLIAFQLLPLPQAIVTRLSPHLAETLPLWTSQADGPAHLGAWSQLSLMPVATRGAVVMLLAYAMLFLVVVQRIETLRDIERVLQCLALAAIAMATIGLAQFLICNGKFLWVYEHPFRDTRNAVKGAFSNENHFAHFLALGIGPLIWWLQSVLGPRGQRRIARFRVDAISRDWQHVGKLALGVGLGLVAFAGLLTFSRGGVLVLFVTTVVCVSIYAVKSLLGKKSLLALLATGLLVGVALVIFGYQPLITELETLSDGSLERLDNRAARRKLWAADMQAVLRYPLLGTGAGSHAEVYPTYYAERADVEFTHAESGYLQVLLESGTAGFLLLLVAAFVCGRWCVRAFRNADSPQATACIVPLLSGILISALHSLWDFVWYIPACMSLTVVVAASCRRLDQLLSSPAPAKRETFVLPRGAWIGAAVVVFGVGLAMVKDRIAPAWASAPWERFIVLSNAAQEAQKDGHLDESVEQMLGLLEETLRRNPQHARAHLRMALVCLRRFEELQQSAQNPMALPQIRDAALASQFASREAQDRWLALAVGANRRYLDTARVHARRAVQLCPLQGDAYVFLAELAFLEGPMVGTKRGYIEQALKVRPHSGAVLVAAGSEAAMLGDIPKALEYWKQAFHQSPEQQIRLIELLAPQLPAEFWIESFEPDVIGLGRLYTHYRKIHQDQQAREIAGPYVQELQRDAQAQSGPESARVWHRAQTVHEYLGDAPRAIACSRKTVEICPHEFWSHQALAMCLYNHQQYDEAIEHLQWCLRRKADDETLKRVLAMAHRKRLIQPTPTVAVDTKSPVR
jgi:O-antigen ligase/tetratricopeptide (TPR) repeat protein